MSIDPSQWQVALHCNVFHYTDCLSNPGPVLGLLDVANETFHHIGFNSEVVATPVGKFQPRKLKSNAKNWAKIRSEVEAGRLGTLVYGALAPDGRMPLGIAFHLSNAIKRRNLLDPSHHHDDFGFWVDSGLLGQDTVTLATCSHLMERAWSLLRGIYGFADLFAAHLGGMVSLAEQAEAQRALRTKLWTFTAQSPGIALGHFIPDAYWLNLLNQAHVAAADDAMADDQMASRLPGLQMHPLPYQGLSLQISPSPFYDAAPAWEQDHLALAKMLCPILRQ